MKQYYRAWIIAEKRLATVLSLDTIEYGGVLVWGKTYTDHTTGEHDADKDFYPYAEVELMQGWQLASGRIVYENDIVEWPVDGDTYRRVVSWDNEDLCVLPNGIDASVITIGNIYEQKDLLPTPVRERVFSVRQRAYLQQRYPFEPEL